MFALMRLIKVGLVSLSGNLVGKDTQTNPVTGRALKKKKKKAEMNTYITLKASGS